MPGRTTRGSEMTDRNLRTLVTVL
ncbi:MAG: hypothetical protein QOI37_429, partial [Chloroflexota bacterium]|nr:hypothetical protein [Chloroflexota bacterium]